MPILHCTKCGYEYTAKDWFKKCPKCRKKKSRGSERLYVESEKGEGGS